MRTTIVKFWISSLFLAAVAAYGDGFTATGSMVYERYNHTATRLLDGRVLVVGGRGYDSSPGGSAEVYNPAAGTWTNTSSLEDPREFHTATLLANGKVLVTGGVNFSAYGPFPVYTRLYNPTNGTWSSSGGGAGVRNSHTATLLTDGKVLLAGGKDNTGVLFNSALRYDPVTDSSSLTGSLGAARYLHTATLLRNGKVLVAGGSGTNGYLTNAEVYDPASGNWTPTGSLGTARSGHTATLLPNGKVLVVGGGTNTAELYNPATGTWSPTGSPAQGGGTATLLPNGKVLVVGTIYGEFGQSTPSAELYDPASGTWLPAGTPLGPRSGHTATLLSNGRVLLAGGFYNSAEVYESFLNPITSPIRLSDGSFKFSFNNPSGQSYHVLASASVAASLNTWSNLGPATETPAGSGQFQFTDHQAPNYPRRFYRMISP